MADERILWVDEDERIWSPERKILLGLGFSVQPFTSATSALEHISSISPADVTLVILDVMLKQGEDDERFSDASTNGGLDTGLVLARAMSSLDKEWSSRILFFSWASTRDHVARIQQTATSMGAQYLKKSRSNQGRRFLQSLKQVGFLKGA